MYTSNMTVRATLNPDAALSRQRTRPTERAPYAAPRRRLADSLDWAGIVLLAASGAAAGIIRLASVINL